MYALAQKHVDHMAWKVLIATQPNPGVASTRVNKYLFVICVKITYQKGWNLQLSGIIIRIIDG